MSVGISLVIAGSRGVDPSDEEITAAVLKLPLPWFVAPSEVDIPTMIREVVCLSSSGRGIIGQNWSISMAIQAHYEHGTPEDVRRWGKFAAPKMRNRRAAARADMGVLFWDGLSDNTPDLYLRMCLREKPVICIPARRVKRGAAKPA